MIRPLFPLMLLAFLSSARADEPAAPLEIAPKTYPATFIDLAPKKTPTPEALSFAMCGVEAHGKESDLDAGLIDLNVPDLARAAGGEMEEEKIQGRNARDFHSSVILGVTVGYRF